MSQNEAALESPIFLVGSERSGTTLLRLMLDHHTELAFNPEFEYAVSQMDDHGNYPDVHAYAHWLSVDFIFPGANFTVDTSLDYPSLVKSFLRQKLERDQAINPKKRIIGATVHHHFDRLLKIWPKARFIHIQRDPRDVARSVMGMGWAGNVWVGSLRWIEAESIWQKMARELPEERHTYIKYEDLIQKPVDELSRLCEFMGIKFDEAMFSYAEKSTYDKPDPKLVYQWRRKLSPEDIGLVESRVGKLLEEAGYEASGHPIPQLDHARVAELEAHSRKICRQWRIKRYGYPLLIMSKLSRMLRIQPLADHFQLKMNDIDLRYIK